MTNNVNNSQKVNTATPLPRPPFPARGVITELKDRGIRRDVAEKYRVETIFNGDTPIARAYPGHNMDGELSGQKIKPLDPEKRMTWLGDHSACTLFGMNAFSKGGKFITITEGEEDALSVYQMLKDDSPSFDPVVVSIKDGAGGAERDCKRVWEFIDSFENVIICFDGDEPGKSAAAKVAQLFPLKSKIVNFAEASFDEKSDSWKLKDGNDYLRANRQKDFVRMWWQAEKYKPKGVISMKDLWKDMTEKDLHITVPYPFEGLNKKLYGMRTGEMVVVKAPPKIGKTLLCRHLAYHIRKTTEHNVGVIFLEDTRKSIGLGFCALEMKKPIQIPDIPYSMEELKKAHEFLSEDERITIFDPEDERTAENIFKKILYFVKAHDCKFIFLDHASMLAYSSGDFDERKFLDKLFADLKGLTTSLNIHLTVVVHVNDDGKTRGSRAPVQLCNALIALERDKLSGDEVSKNTTDIVVEENRISGDSGLACKLFYDRDTGLLNELDLDKIIEEQKKVDKERTLTGDLFD